MLNMQDWEQVKALQQEVEQADRISLKLNWDMLRARKPEDCDDFVCRRDGRIVGFLGLYDFASKIEICGMVAPMYRRQGIFSSLLSEALPPDRADRYKSILLNVPAASATGSAFASRLGIQIAFTEYQMKFNPRNRGTLVSPPKSVSLRPARHSDLDYLIALDMQGFGLTEEEAAQLTGEALSAGFTSSAAILYVVELDGICVGKVRVHYDPEESWIYGFVIDAGLRGQGIGRSVLMNIIHEEQAKSREVFLEVAAENETALNLYRSCGFDNVQVQDYYRYLPVSG